MSRILYVDCFAGAAGDMFLGALLDVGVPLQAVMGEVEKLRVPGVGIRVEREARHSIVGVRVHVEIGGRAVLEGEGIRARRERRAHHHDHDHDYDHDHVIEAHGPEHAGGHGRHYVEIDALLAGAGLESRTEGLARKAFRLLAEAEAKVHGVPVEEVHFHEVGAVDALVDVVGTAAAIAHLAPDEVVASPIPFGRGLIQGAHGQIPIPAPATVEILAGAPVYGIAEEGETVTPTGAALLAALADRFGPLPSMSVEKVGHGVGARDPKTRPNLLRVLWGVSAAAPLERLEVLEANIDDMNPQLFEPIFESLLAGGARDVWLTPVQMKKGRPASVLSVLCEPGRRDELLHTIVRETTTIGVRIAEVTRFALPREIREVTTRFGAVRIKIARDGGEIVNVSPEYEDCRRLALAAGVPLKQVMQAAVRAAADEMES
jgi:uncharacterized protein (TIGR00299 family) protein